MVCLAGGIASGKTTVAQALTTTYPNSAVRSFGDVVRKHARKTGLGLDRGALQAAGLQLIAAGWPNFVDELLADLTPAATILIVDGIRHVEAVDELRRHFPRAQVRLVFLVTNEQDLSRRMAERGEPMQVRHHQIESSLTTVAHTADLTIETSTAPNRIAARIAAEFRPPTETPTD